MSSQTALQKHTILLFLGLYAIIYLLINFYSKKYLVTDQLFYDYYAKSVPTERLEAIMQFKQKFDWLDYLLIPFLILLKVIAIASFINIGIYVFDYKMRFTDVLNIVCCAEVIFVLMAITKILYFSVNGISNPESMADFSPFSLYQLVQKPNIYAKYPLQVLNLFEITYFVFLTKLIATKAQISIFKSVSLIALTYGLPLLIWISIIVFLQALNY
jgi:hypothetical protein